MVERESYMHTELLDGGKWIANLNSIGAEGGGGGIPINGMDISHEMIISLGLLVQMLSLVQGPCSQQNGVDWVGQNCFRKCMFPVQPIGLLSLAKGLAAAPSSGMVH